MVAGAATDGILEPGSELNGTYVIVQRLAEGGMGDIYEARHVRLTGRYAVKVLRHSLTAQHASAFDRFRREAEVTSSLRHPHIVQVLDFNQVPSGAAYFVMELLEGQNLRQHLETHGAMSVPDVAIIIEQVASALQAVHERGIVHRDLKPENIHLVPIAGRKEPFVKVLDFGISKVLTASTLTQEKMLVGTPHYMAPEQAMGGSDDLDGRTDQFSLGAIAHELLTGKRLFESESVAAIIYQVLHEPAPSVIPVAGEMVNAAIQRALAKNRDDRFPQVVDFADALREAVFGPPRTSLPMVATSTGNASGRVLAVSTPAGLSGPTFSPTPSRPGGPPVSIPATPGRRQRLVLGIGALAVAAAVAAGVVVSGGTQPHPTWTPAEGDAMAVGSQLDATIRRVLDEENGRFAETVGRAAKVPHIANAVTGRVDDATFQDLLANELWWGDFRAFGCAVLVGDAVKVAWHLPAPKPDLAALLSAVVSRANAVGAAAEGGPRAALVSDVAGGPMLAGVSPIEGVPGGHLLLVRPVDRALVADLATRANTVLVLSDGRQLLGVSVPDNTIPEIGLLVGKEEAHVLIDKRHARLAAAVPWSRALWLWGVTGWSS